MKSSLVTFNHIDIERMLETYQGQCYTYLYDAKEKSFFYQLCQPVKRQCLQILDHINCKLLLVEEVGAAVGEVQEIDGGALDIFSQKSGSILSSREFDHLFVTSNVLKNYGTHFDKALSPE